MIFNNNSHSNIGLVAAAPGYDCSCGAGKLMIESAQNDYNMFMAMLNTDYSEISMRESGVVTEAEVIAKIKSTASTIWGKIVELFKKLASKLRSILDTFIAKMRTICMNDVKLAKKYQAAIKANSNTINTNVIVKWKELDNSAYDFKLDSSLVNSIDKVDNFWAETKDGILDKMAKDAGNYSGYKDFTDSFVEDSFGAESEITVGQAGGAVTICDYIINNDKVMQKFKDASYKVIKLANDAVKTAETNKKQAESAAKKDNATEADQEVAKAASKAYDVASATQVFVTKFFDLWQSILKQDYKQHRAALAKIVTAAAGKTHAKNESVYMDALAEAAEEEVDEVIDTAVDGQEAEDIADLTAASLNVLDSDTTGDPNALVYDKVDNYSIDAPMDDSEGEIDIDVNSREESAFFSKPLY